MSAQALQRFNINWWMQEKVAATDGDYCMAEDALSVAELVEANHLAALRQRDERIEELQAELDALRSAAHAGGDNLVGEVLTLRAWSRRAYTVLKGLGDAGVIVDHWLLLADAPDSAKASTVRQAHGSATGG